MSIISVVQHAASYVSVSLSRPLFLSSQPYFARQNFSPGDVNGERLHTGGRGLIAAPQEQEQVTGRLS